MRFIIFISGINFLFPCSWCDCFSSKAVTTRNGVVVETSVPEPESNIELFTQDGMYVFDIANPQCVIVVGKGMPTNHVSDKVYCPVGEFPCESLFQLRVNPQGEVGFQRVKLSRGKIVPCGSSVEDIENCGLWLKFNRKIHQNNKLSLTTDQSTPGYIKCDPANRIDLSQDLDKIASICLLNGACVYIDKNNQKFWIKSTGAGFIDIKFQPGYFYVGVSGERGGVSTNGNQREMIGLDLLVVTDKNGNRFFAVGQVNPNYEIGYLYYVTLEEESNLELANLEEAKSSFAAWKDKWDEETSRSLARLRVS